MDSNNPENTPQDDRIPMLSIEDLSVSFKSAKGPQSVVNSISFDIYEGETFALVGESGSGKSVTALSILQLLPYPAASHPNGSIRYYGKNLVGAPDNDLMQIRGNDISMIFQEPMTSLNPLHSIGQQVGESIMLHRGCGVKEARQRTLELLQLVSIPEAESRLASYPHELSGGQRQRVMIAMALANEPKLLIADEPTTALDVIIQKEILELIQDLQQKLNMAVLLITHDLGIVQHFSHRVGVMYDGDLLEVGDTQQIFAHPQHQYTRTLLAAKPSGTAVASAPDAPTLLSANDLCVYFPIKKGVFQKTVDHLKAVDQVSCEVRAGQTLGVVGESGSGKTTLGLALVRLIGSAGEIRLGDLRLDNLDQNQMRPLRRNIQIVFQDPYGSLSPRMSVAEIIGEGLDIHQPELSSSHDEIIIDVLQEVGLSADVRHRYPHEFSGGQRQRIAIARAMVLKPDLIILDEPTSALDRTVQCQLIDLLKKLQADNGLSYIFISHDLAVVRSISHQIMVMKQGQIVEYQPTESLFKQQQHPYTKALLAAAYE